MMHAKTIDAACAKALPPRINWLASSAFVACVFVFSSLKGAECNFSNANLRAGYVRLILLCVWIVSKCVAGDV